jgi:ankyrin repeat protein
VYCQLVYLRGCHPGRIRHALSELPETLDETYERTLREINKADWELAHRLFQCVAVASRPLQVDELAEFLAFDFTAEPVAKFQEGWRLEDPVDAVLSTCSTLLALVNVDGSAIIQFSHFSVKEFLTSARLAKADEEILCRYSISMAPAHTLITQASLGILLHLDETITKQDLTKYPLAEYAGRHWVKHALFENVAQEVEEGLKRLFDPDKPHLSIWIWICDPRNPSMDSDRAERPSTPGGTPLHYATMCGLQNVVKFLAIEHSRDLNSRGFDEESTALHVASTYGHLEIAHILVEHGVDTTACTNWKRTPLHIASEHGHVEIVRFLLEHGADVTARDNDGATPLHRASVFGHVEVARLLVERFPDVVLTQDMGGGTPLQVASIGGHVELIHFLAGKGSNIQALYNGDGWSSLHQTAIFGRAEAARILFEHGAEPSARAKDGRTPLHVASSYGHLEVVRVLIECGADLMASADNGQTPLHVASSRGNVVVARILVEHGANVNAQDRKWWMPLHDASFCGSVEMARFLVEHGADVTARDNKGLSPRDVASRKGYAEVAHFLDEHGAHTISEADDRRTPSSAPTEEADVRGTSATSGINIGWTPLHLAAAQGNVEVVRILVERGADTIAQTEDGRTPLHVAAQVGNTEIVRILVEHGTNRTTAQPTPAQGSRLVYYFVALCFFVEMWLHFL